ncbi:AI-2E family transporter [Rhodosalinus halophilus]|uniref:AI-2E family transporter n=1 Tax=Rhodosalinus halophilus TaxID=2259333 RepID=UPI001313FE32|nr:AI-2E family transporter [Rhodosalinus halophilus]
MDNGGSALRAHRRDGVSWLAIPAALLTIVLTLVLLEIGQQVLLPILLAVIAVYVLIETERFLASLPVLRHMPRLILRLCVLITFIALLVAFGLVIEGTLGQIAEAAPRYQANFESMFTGVAVQLGVDGETLWQSIATRVSEAVDLEVIVGFTLASAGNFGMLLFLVAIYASFLMAERHTLQEKLSRIFRAPEDAERAARVVKEINDGIGGYLATKTLLNVVVGAMSYVVMLLFGVDFALLWALIIGLLGYIPYIGSYAGVAFPVLLSLAQFGNIGTTLLLAAALTVIQLWEGNWFEPKVIGKKSNLSPFVVLVALGAWSALWGVPGAIFAVPLTSMIVIVCGAFEQTRWVPILLSQDARRVGHAAAGPGASES